MKKNIIISFAVIIIFVIIIFVILKNNSKYKENEKDNIQEIVDIKYGGSEEKTVILDSEKIVLPTVEQKYFEEIQSFIKGNRKYENTHKKFVKELKELYHGNEVKISKVPIFEWDADRNNIIYNYPKIVVFSEDLKKRWIFQLLYENNRYNLYTSEEISKSVFDLLKEKKDEEYIYFGTYNNEELINNDNKMYPISSYNLTHIKIKGDYYKKISKLNISFSYDNLTDECIQIGLN